MDGQTSTSQSTDKILLTKAVEEIPVNPPQQNPSNLGEGKNTPVPSGAGRSFLFKILLITIIPILFFGVLNFLNILPLSKMFPKQLGWLPHKEVPTGTSQSNNIAIPPAATPTVSLTDQRGYSLVPSQAKQTLLEFLPTILNSSLLPQPPSDIKLTEDKGIKQGFSGSWDAKDGKAIAILTLSTDGIEISQLLIFFPYTTSTSASVELAQSTIPKLFSITPKGKWGCKTLNNNTIDYCENFWEEENRIRRGVAVKGNRSYSQAKKLTVLFCEHSQTSTLYSWRSCQFEFAKTGVQ